MLRYLHRKTAPPKRGDLRRCLQTSGSKRWATTAPWTPEEILEYTYFTDAETLQCMICNDLDLDDRLELNISIADLLDPPSGCFACFMLSTMLQPWLKPLGPRAELLLYTSEMGMALELYRDQHEDSLDRSFILQSVGENPSPWPCIPKRCMTRGISEPHLAAQTILSWLEACDSSHACKEDSVPGLLPKRILEIQAPRAIRLYQPAEDEAELYACLSHCWGESVPLRLTSSNIRELKEAISWNSLPATFQQAIDLVSRLGLRFIWIDSLCIIQDDTEDWQDQGSKMAEIYWGARLTLAASASANSMGGLFQPEDASEIRQMHRFVGADNSPHYILIRPETDLPYSEDAYLPLKARAWFFQEWLLSPRVVQFTDALLLWECCDIQQSDDGSVFKRSYHYAGGKKSTLTSLNRHQSLSPLITSPEDLQIATWHGIVSMYSRLKLTFHSDVFLALQGITARIAAERRCNFYAGLWEDSLVLDLLWCSEEPTPTTEYRAPSWSWASSSGQVDWHTAQWLRPWMISGQAFFTPEASVVSVITVPVGKSPFGQVSDGVLVLKGLCLPAVFEPQRNFHNIYYPRVKINRTDKHDEYIPVASKDYWRWHPSTLSVPKPDADVQVMLIGRRKYMHGESAYQSFFLAFERASNVDDTYKRIGLLDTVILLDRVRFRQHAMERELTII